VGPGGRYITEQRFDYVSIDLFNGLVGHFDGSADARSRGTRASCGGKASPPNFASSLFAHRHRDCPVRPPPCSYSVLPPWRHILLDGRRVRFQVMLTRIEPPNVLGQFRCRNLMCSVWSNLEVPSLTACYAPTNARNRRYFAVARVLDQGLNSTVRDGPRRHGERLEATERQPRPPADLRHRAELVASGDPHDSRGGYPLGVLMWGRKRAGWCTLRPDPPASTSEGDQVHQAPRRRRGRGCPKRRAIGAYNRLWVEFLRVQNENKKSAGGGPDPRSEFHGRENLTHNRLLGPVGI
jgi:hypothetical protein